MAKKWKFDWKEKKEQIKREEAEKKSFGADERFWKLSVDDKKKGSAIIRFLPDQEGTPYKQYFSHFFRYEGTKGTTVYAENCATSIGEHCPVCEKNREYWKSPFERDKNIARDRKRKVHYVSNVYIVKDPGNPDNEGKVFLFDYGAQIFKPFKEAMFGPEDATDEELETENLFVPCDFDEGADFLAKSTTKKGSDNWVTYESSKFKPQSRFLNELEGDEWEEAIDKVMEQVVAVSEWENADKYPKAETVSAKLSSILGITEVKVEDAKVEDVSIEDDTDSEEPEMDASEDVKINEDMSDDDFFESIA